MPDTTDKDRIAALEAENARLKEDALAQARLAKTALEVATAAAELANQKQAKR